MRAVAAGVRCRALLLRSARPGGHSSIDEPGGFNTDIKTSISFPLQLASAPTVDQVPFSSTDSHCSGNTGSPTAARGYLCIYIRGTTNSAPFSPNQPLYPQEPANLNYGAGTAGVILTARANAAGTVEILGSWAVTAP
jgi:hypothetical protein